MHTEPPDWSPQDPSASDNQLATYDRLRHSCPVAFREDLGWSLFRHADVMAVLGSPDTFSSDVSQHLSVPNGMDPPQHTRFRRVIDPYFAPERVEQFAPAFRAIARDLVVALPGGDVEMMDAVGHPFAAQVQCTFMGWPTRLRGPLRAWTASHQDANRRKDRRDLAELAASFDAIIRAQLDERRASTSPPDDTTTQLLAERIDGRALADDELVSIIRNWTAGELGTIAASIGIVVQHLANDRDLQASLRAGAGRCSSVIDEILRLNGPLTTNRRRTTRAVRIGGRQIGADERITILWPSANRDEAVFGDGVFDPEAHARDNLLYGSGIHACPGAPLARRELEILVHELLAGTSEIRPTGNPTPASYPAGGYASVPVTVTKAHTR